MGKDDIRCHFAKQEPWENSECNKVIFCENDGWGGWQPCVDEDASEDQGQKHIFENWSLLEALFLTHLSNWINTTKSNIRHYSQETNHRTLLPHWEMCNKEEHNHTPYEQVSSSGATGQNWCCPSETWDLIHRHVPWGNTYWTVHSTSAKPTMLDLTNPEAHLP